MPGQSNPQCLVCTNRPPMNVLGPLRRVGTVRAIFPAADGLLGQDHIAMSPESLALPRPRRGLGGRGARASV